MEWNQHFCLKWNNYSSKICSAFNDLWLEGEQIDLCIITGERKLHAHRIILSACSLFFRDALKDVPMNQIAVLVLPTINTDDLEDLLQFIYTGEVNVEESRLKSLVDTANLLKIEGICGRSDKIDSSFKEPHALEKLLAATTRKDPLESTPKETKESASENLSGTSGSNLNTQAKLEQSPATNADILMKAEIEDDDDNSSFFDSEAKVNFQDSSNMSSWSNNSANNGEPECKHDSDMKMDDAMNDQSEEVEKILLRNGRVVYHHKGYRYFPKHLGRKSHGLPLRCRVEVRDGPSRASCRARLYIHADGRVELRGAHIHPPELKKIMADLVQRVDSSYFDWNIGHEVDFSTQPREPTPENLHMKISINQPTHQETTPENLHMKISANQPIKQEPAPENLHMKISINQPTHQDPAPENLHMKISTNRPIKQEPDPENLHMEISSNQEPAPENLHMKISINQQTNQEPAPK